MAVSYGVKQYRAHTADRLREGGATLNQTRPPCVAIPNTTLLREKNKSTQFTEETCLHRHKTAAAEAAAVAPVITKKEKKANEPRTTLDPSSPRRTPL